MCRDGQLDDGLTGPQTTQASSNIGLLAWMEYLMTIRVRLSRLTDRQVAQEQQQLLLGFQ